MGFGNKYWKIKGGEKIESEYIKEKTVKIEIRIWKEEYENKTILTWRKWRDVDVDKWHLAETH